MKWTIVALCLVFTPVVGARELADAVRTQQEMIVTANPLATEAGAEVLESGGTAVDAMIAAQTVLGLVEPQSSGIGGGAFVVFYDAEAEKIRTFDAREKAPAAAKAERFLKPDGTPMEFTQAWQSGLSVGVPGVPRLLEYLHERYGRLPWAELFNPATALAREGFELTERTSRQVQGLLEENTSCEPGARLFFRDPLAFSYLAREEGCTAKPAGTLVRNLAYAQALERIAEQGADAFYQGKIAESIVAAVTTDPHIPGDMTVEDLANYRVVERPPVCVDYREHRVCGMGPPSSGGIAVGQILGVLENFELGSHKDPLSVMPVHLFAQAGRLAFADRNRYVADADFTEVPVQGLLDREYLSQRADLIGASDLGHVEPGDPPGHAGAEAADPRTKVSGTSHISIVDRYGNALSMTTSVESSFGNGVMVPDGGFFLNNQLTDFSFRPDRNGAPVANRVEPEKRPRSSMSPTIVLTGEGQVRYITGSPGGSRIIGYTAQSIINMIDFNLDPQEAINVPHYMNRNGSTDLERPIPGITRDYAVQTLVTALESREHEVKVLPQTSGLSTIRVDPETLVGGRDLRRDGAVGGQ